MSLFDHYKEISKILGEQIETVVKIPFFWVFIFLLLACLVLTYNGTSQNRLSGSLINTVRLFGTFLIDTFNSIVQACKSLFGFLDVLRLLLFGHLGHGTLYVLTNYAIIFLSMASFATTLQGLFSLIGWIGILVSFGIQVMELVAITGILICIIPAKSKTKEIITYTYQCQCTVTATATATPSATASQQITATNSKKSKFKWGRLRLLLLILALLIAYLGSVFFSYCYIFDTIVMPDIAYDDYIESIDLVNEQTERYEKELTIYRTELVKGLTRFLIDLTDYAHLSENNFATVDALIQSYEDDELSLQNSMASISNSLAELPQDSEQVQSLMRRWQTMSDNLAVVQDELAKLRTNRSSSQYVLYQAIQVLTQYLADPLYLSGNGNEPGEVVSKEQKLSEAFDIVMTQGYMLYSDEFSVSPEQLRTAFSNYTLLCRYYAVHGSSGLNLSETGDGTDSLNTLLAQRIDIITHYNELKDTVIKETDTQSENTDIDEILSLDPAHYLNKETGRLLIAAMRAIEGTPRFSVVGELWPNSALTGTGGIYPKEPESAN